MLLGTLEPAPPGGKPWTLPIPYAWYPLLYTLKIVLTLAAIAWCGRGYRQFPLRLSPWAILVGLAGAVVWMASARWGGLEAGSAKASRSAGSATWGPGPPIIPFDNSPARPLCAWAFLGVRFLGLVAWRP